MSGIYRLRRLFLNTARIICIHSNERSPFASDLEGFAEANSLTFNELVKTTFVLVFDQRACAGLRGLQPATAFFEFLNGFLRCKLVDCGTDDFFLVDFDSKFQRSLR
jgi:hypothetical protein